MKIASHPKELQALLNKAATAVYQQGHKSVTNSGTYCAYRGRDGHRCAVGHLLSDEQLEKYRIRENTSVNSVAFPDELLKELAPNCAPSRTRNFLCHLQDMHDFCQSDPFLFKETFAKNIAAFSQHWNLVNPLTSTGKTT